MSVSSIAKLLTKHGKELGKFGGTKLDTNELAKFSACVGNMLRLTRKDQVAGIYYSLQHLHEKTVDNRDLLEAFRRIAANRAYIKDGLGIPVWGGEPIRVSIGVIRVARPETKRPTVPLIEITYRCLDSILAGQVQRFITTQGYVMKMFRTRMGLSHFRDHISPFDIGGMVLSPTVYRGEKGYISWSNVAVSAKAKEFNKGLVNERKNIIRCTVGHPPCNRCEISRSKCRLGVR